MTTISPNRRPGSRTSRARLAWYGAAFLVLFSALLLWRQSAAGLLWRALAPLASAREEAAASSGGILSLFSSNASLAAELEAAKAQLASANIALMDRDLLYAENRELKARLNRAPATTTARTLAAVIMRPPGVPYDTLMLDIGSDDGVAVGDLAAAGGSVYIGRISSAYANTSRVTLFSAPGEAHEAFLVNAATGESVPLAVAGQGGGSFVGEVSAGTAVAIGDRVIFANLQPQFIAQVVGIDSPEEKSFKTVYLQMPVNPLSLRFVEVEPAAGPQP